MSIPVLHLSANNAHDRITENDSGSAQLLPNDDVESTLQRLIVVSSLRRASAALLRLCKDLAGQNVGYVSSDCLNAHNGAHFDDGFTNYLNALVTRAAGEIFRRRPAGEGQVEVSTVADPFYAEFIATQSGLVPDRRICLTRAIEGAKVAVEKARAALVRQSSTLAQALIGTSAGDIICGVQQSPNAAQPEAEGISRSTMIANLCSALMHSGQLERSARIRLGSNLTTDDSAHKTSPVTYATFDNLVAVLSSDSGLNGLLASAEADDQQLLTAWRAFFPSREPVGKSVSDQPATGTDGTQTRASGVLPPVQQPRCRHCAPVAGDFYRWSGHGAIEIIVSPVDFANASGHGDFNSDIARPAASNTAVATPHSGYVDVFARCLEVAGIVAAGADHMELDAYRAVVAKVLARAVGVEDPGAPLSAPATRGGSSADTAEWARFKHRVEMLDSLGSHTAVLTREALRYLAQARAASELARVTLETVQSPMGKPRWTKPITAPADVAGSVSGLQWAQAQLGGLQRRLLACPDVDIEAGLTRDRHDSLARQVEERVQSLSAGAAAGPPAGSPAGGPVDSDHAYDDPLGLARSGFEHLSVSTPPPLSVPSSAYSGSAASVQTGTSGLFALAHTLLGGGLSNRNPSRWLAADAVGATAGKPLDRSIDDETAPEVAALTSAPPTPLHGGEHRSARSDEGATPPIRRTYGRGPITPPRPLTLVPSSPATIRHVTPARARMLDESGDGNEWWQRDSHGATVSGDRMSQTGGDLMTAAAAEDDAGDTGSGNYNSDAELALDSYQTGGALDAAEAGTASGASSDVTVGPVLQYQMRPTAAVAAPASGGGTGHWHRVVTPPVGDDEDGGVSSASSPASNSSNGRIEEFSVSVSDGNGEDVRSGGGASTDASSPFAAGAHRDTEAGGCTPLESDDDSDTAYAIANKALARGLQRAATNCAQAADSETVLQAARAAHAGVDMDLKRARASLGQEAAGAAADDRSLPVLPAAAGAAPVSNGPAPGREASFASHGHQALPPPGPGHRHSMAGAIDGWRAYKAAVDLTLKRQRLRNVEAALKAERAHVLKLNAAGALMPSPSYDGRPLPGLAYPPPKPVALTLPPAVLAALAAKHLPPGVSPSVAQRLVHRAELLNDLLETSMPGLDMAIALASLQDPSPQSLILS